MAELIKHGLYFRLTYADVSKHCPVIDTFIYLGKNLFPSDKQDTWYFQCAYDFGMYGSFLKHHRQDRKFICLGVAELGSMLSPSRLIHELKKY